MNELQAVKVDGKPVQFGDFSHFRQSWGSHSLNFELVLPELKPGLHMVELDVRSQIVNDEDLLGLSSAAPAEDWPTPINAWNRSVAQEFYVFAADEELVNLSVDASLDPVTEGALSIDEILVHSVGDGVSLVLPFQLDELPISVCFDVMLQLGKEQVACGVFWVALDSGGEMTMRSESNLRVELAQFDTTLREVSVRLKPQVGAIEHVAAVDQIWGSEVVFERVPLKRLDLGE